MFGSRFKATKCKLKLQQGIERSKIMQNRRMASVQRMKGEIAELLRGDKESEALIKVERLLQEEAILTAYEIIMMFCQTVCGKLTQVDTTKSCPVDLKTPIASIMYAAPICGDVPELLEVKTMFTSKYGKEFAASASQLRVDCGVDNRVVKSLSVSPPSSEKKLAALKRIATEQGVAWDPPESERDDATSHAATHTMPVFRASSPHGNNHPGSSFPDRPTSSPDRGPVIQPTAEHSKPRESPWGTRGDHEPAAHFQPPPSPLSVLRIHPSGNGPFGGVDSKSPRGGGARQPVGPEDSFSSTGSVATPRAHDRRLDPGERSPGTPPGTRDGRFEPGNAHGGTDRGEQRSPLPYWEDSKQRALAKALENAAQTVVSLTQILTNSPEMYEGGEQFQGEDGRPSYLPQQTDRSQMTNRGEGQTGGANETRRRSYSPRDDRYDGGSQTRAGNAFQQPGYETGDSRREGQTGGREHNRVKEDIGSRNGFEEAFGRDSAASIFQSDGVARNWQGNRSPRRLPRGDDYRGFGEGLIRHATAPAAPTRAEGLEQRSGIALGRRRTPRESVFDAFEADSLSEGESRPPLKAPGGIRRASGLRPVDAKNDAPGVERSPSPNGDDLGFAFPPPPPSNLSLPSAKFPVKSVRGVLPPPPKRHDDRGRYFKETGSPRRGQSPSGDAFELPPASPDSEGDEVATRMRALRFEK